MVENLEIRLANLKILRKFFLDGNSLESVLVLIFCQVEKMQMKKYEFSNRIS